MTGISSRIYAQRPPGDFGFGLILGDPLGGTIKYWTSPTNALVADIGESYFGVPRIDVDYLWHFNSFNSRVVLLYGGIGGAVGFGYDYGYYGVFYSRGEGRPFYYRYGTTSSVGIGVRAIFGLTIVPKRTPLEFFLEAGPLLGIVPTFGVGFDLAVGVRFYP
ncbi:MAG: hypothetical protein ACHQM6_01620 [Candidatus Kapaibacterium sp.]